MSDLTNVQRLVGEAQDAHQRWENEKERALEAVDVAQVALMEMNPVTDFDERDRLNRNLESMQADLEGLCEEV